MSVLPVRSSRRRVAVAAAVAATGLTALSTVDAGAATRLTSIDVGRVVDDHGFAPTANSYANGFTIDSVGTQVALAWTDNRVDDPFTTSDADVEFRQSTDGGTTWGPLMNLTHEDGRRTAGWADGAAGKSLITWLGSRPKR